MDIRLRPLRDEEFPVFHELLVHEYVRGLVDDAGMERTAADEKAAADLASVFPKTTSAEPNHRIYFLEDAETGETAGYVFWAERRPPGSEETRAYLYELFVDDAFRRKGLGLRALELLEGDVRDRGLPGIDLNVWGGNAAARSLYSQAGFAERAVLMSKELA
jgi:ribosomal protein S18 acetylase RimI-like enzyme